MNQNIRASHIKQLAHFSLHEIFNQIVFLHVIWSDFTRKKLLLYYYLETTAKIRQSCKLLIIQNKSNLNELLKKMSFYSVYMYQFLLGWYLD